jgi:5'-methylthioadenosine nucleosidase
MLTYASIVSLHPDLIINAGTAGGFRAKGAAIGDVFVATQFANHDRRIPVPVFDEYGIGTLAATPIPNLVKALELKEGKLSTGNSLDMTPQDEEIIKANDATIKDMEVSSNITCMHLSLSSCVQAGIANILTGNLFLETSLIILGGATALCLVWESLVHVQGAAVAYVANLLTVPLIAMKAVTDIVDGDKPTVEEFLGNMSRAAAALSATIPRVLEYVNAKSISNLWKSFCFLETDPVQMKWLYTFFCSLNQEDFLIIH